LVLFIPEQGKNQYAVAAAPRPAKDLREEESLGKEKSISTKAINVQGTYFKRGSLKSSAGS